MKMDNLFFSSDDNDNNSKSKSYFNCGFMGLQDFGSFVYDHDHVNVLSDEFFFSGGDHDLGCGGGNEILAVDSCFRGDHHDDHRNQKVLVLPSTPNNSSSVSSLSCEVINDQQGKVHVDGDNGEHEQHGTKKELKAKKTNNRKKKQIEPRIAFMTKTDVDHLEDGYRWRKYGQKAVKSSPFPRSYFRCTSATCGVKKRVERSRNDPTVVVTTYEGQHTHPSPITPRANNNPTTDFPGSAFFSGAQQPTFANIPLQHQQLVHHHHNSPSSLNLPYGAAQNSVFCSDNGLLQDIIPSLMPKEEK